jgi:hypothetical protein
MPAPPAIPTTVIEGDDADARLAEFGLTADLLRQVAGAAYTDASQSSALEPRSYPGTTKWAKGTRYFREATIVDGWEPDSTDNFESTINPSGTQAVALVGGTPDTGRKDATPRNARKRGAAAVRAVKKGQLNLLESALTLDTAAPDLWMFLHHHDEDAAEIRLELSLPNTIEAGFVTSWTERIVIAAEPFDGITRSIADDGDPDVDVDVRRRAS